MNILKLYQIASKNHDDLLKFVIFNLHLKDCTFFINKNTNDVSYPYMAYVTLSNILTFV